MDGEKTYTLADYCQNPELASKELIRSKLVEAPYSQAWQRIAEIRGLDNAFPIARYDWSQNLDTSGSKPDKESIAVVKTSKSKSKRAPKKNTKTTSKSATVATSSKKIKLELEAVPASQTANEPEKKALEELSSKGLTAGLTAKKTQFDDAAGSSSYSKWLSNLSQRPTTEASVSQELEVKEKGKIRQEASKAEQKKQKKKGKGKKSKKELKKSIDDSIKSRVDIASEALARLFAEQGHHDKAIQMYERLSLINPEKSSFFAPLIQNLKKNRK